MSDQQASDDLPILNEIRGELHRAFSTQERTAIAASPLRLGWVKNANAHRTRFVAGAVGALSVTSALAVLVGTSVAGSNQAPSDAYSILQATPTSAATLRADLPAHQAAGLLDRNPGEPGDIHEIRLPGGYTGFVTPTRTGPAGGMCVAFDDPGDQPDVVFCANGNPGANGDYTYGGGTGLNSWNMEGVEPDAAKSVVVTLSNGSTVVAPVVSNMFYAVSAQPMVSYKVVDSTGAELSTDTLPGNLAPSDGTIVTSH